MNRLHPVLRYPLLMVFSAAPFLLNAICWRSGGVDEILWFFPVLALLSFLHFRFSDGWISCLLLQGFLLPCAYLSCNINTELYYRHIGHDFETRLVGELILLIELFSIVFLTVPLVISKAKAGR